VTSTTLNATLGGQLNHLASLSNKVLCVSHAQKNIISKQLPQLREKIDVIYNPMPQLSQTPITGDDLGFLGGPNPAKGFRILHSALKCVKFKAATLHATNFPEPMQEHLGHAKISYYKKLGSKQLDDFYTKIRALIFPSICPEPLPYALCEAILRGRLAIVSNIGGIPEIAQGCKGIFQFDAANIEQLTELIEYTYSLSAQKTAELAAYDREIFASRFNNDLSIDKFVNCCNELLNEIK
jgi:glycosyltransferase involved in cell wall biosynthesis